MLDFVERDGWILPTEGTLGQKASNLKANTEAIKAAGFSIPRSMVIPFEYLDAVDKDPIFVINNINTHFPNLEVVIVRSSAPDEDLVTRIPGQYDSAALYRWKPSGKHTIENVIKSYNLPAAARKRAAFGMPEKGMSLLIQEPVSRIRDPFYPDYLGCYTEIPNGALLTFNNPTAGVDSMKSEPFKKDWINSDGTLREPTREPWVGTLAEKLTQLAHSLPSLPRKGWEIEFVGVDSTTYIVQTTPVAKSIAPDLSHAQPAENIFSLRKARLTGNNGEPLYDDLLSMDPVIGTGEVNTNGILFVPDRDFSVNSLVEFDSMHQNYCLITRHIVLSYLAFRYKSPLEFITRHLAHLDLIPNYWEQGKRPFSSHFAQSLREGRVMLGGRFPKSIEPRLQYLEGIDKGPMLYSPARLHIRADEFSQQAHVQLLDPEKLTFSPVSN